MTDRINALCVVLAHDIRTDDVEPLVQAIGHLRGVLSVTPNVSDYAAHVGEERARQEIRQKILDVVYPDRRK